MDSAIQNTLNQLPIHQWHTEDQTCELVAALIRCCGHRNIVESGTFMGKMTLHMMGAKPDGGRLITIDITDHRPDCLCIPQMVSRYQFIEGDSRDALRSVSKEVVDGVDLLYLDTIHTKEHVMQELDSAWPMIKPSSMVTVHDVYHPAMAGLMESMAAMGMRGMLVDTPKRDIAPMVNGFGIFQHHIE
jgi:predicted O-methyltransferase YrrM